jgi:hypothetical protein
VNGRCGQLRTPVPHISIARARAIPLKLQTCPCLSVPHLNRGRVASRMPGPPAKKSPRDRYASRDRRRVEPANHRCFGRHPIHLSAHTVGI